MKIPEDFLDILDSEFPISIKSFSNSKESISNILKYIDYIFYHDNEIIQNSNKSNKSDYLKSIYPFQINSLFSIKEKIESYNSKINYDYINEIIKDEEKSKFLLSNYKNMPIKVYEILKIEK